MVEVIKAEVSEALTKKFRKRAMEIYGYKKGAVKAALEDAMKRFVASGDVDWGSLRGCIESELTSVELQHKMWRKVD
jgi:peroxiredoxin